MAALPQQPGRACGRQINTPRPTRRGRNQEQSLLKHPFSKTIAKHRERTQLGASRRLALDVSENLMILSNFLSTGSLGVLLCDYPVPAVKHVTAAASDAALGPAASPSMRLLLRRAMRAAIALSSAAGVALRVYGAVGLLATLDQNPANLASLTDVSTEAEVLSTVDSLLEPVIPRALPLRAAIALASIAVFLVKLRTTSEALAHLDFEHSVVAGAVSVLDMMTSGSTLLENCKDLMRVGAAAIKPSASGPQEPPVAEANADVELAAEAEAEAEAGRELPVDI